MDRVHLRCIWKKSMFFSKCNTILKKSIGVTNTHRTPPPSVPDHKPSPANSTPEMDRKIWAELPVEILERILSMLPPKTFISLRSTCRYFHSLIFSPLLISKHTNLQAPSPFSSYILLSHPQSNNYLLYDTVLNTWRDIILPLSRSIVFAPLLTTCTSLLCFSAVSDSSNSAFFIYNLLARSSRVVKFPEFPFSFEFPTVVVNPNGYKLFCLSYGSSYGPNVSAFVYDSSAHDWTRYQGFQRTLGYTSTCHQQGVHYNGSLYFATCEPFLVVGFNLSTGRWGTCEADLPDELTFVRLVSGNGNGSGSGNRLFMFGGIGTVGISRSMKIWELDQNGRNWNEIKSVPEFMCRKIVSVCYHNYEHIYCFWHQAMLCVCCYTWPEVLYYKVERRTWHWLPKCPSLPNKWNCGFKWFSFVPELNGYV